MSERIGVLFLQSAEEFGADAAVHANLMRYLDRDKFEVHVACTAGKGAEASPSWRVFSQIPGAHLRQTAFMPRWDRTHVASWFGTAALLSSMPQDFWNLRRYARANRIRLIHSNDRPRNTLHNVLLGRATGAKSIVHVHVKWSDAHGKLARWGVQAADAVVGISQYVSSTVVATGRASQDVYTVPNAIDVSCWDPSTDGSAVRQELGISQDATLLASVSRLFSWKGQRELLQAFALARGQRRDLKLMIVGEPAAGHGSTYAAELRDLAAALGVASDVIFTGGRADIPRVMAACDVFTLPSFEEPFGLVFLEAMAMAKPVIAVNNGGTPEVVEHGRSGLLSPPWDIPALAANISTLVQEPELRSRLGGYGRERVVRYFNAQRMARDAERAYEAILAR